MGSQRVLVVEDDIRLAKLTQSYLEQHDYGVQTVHSGGEVVPICQRIEFDIILLDLNLPEKDGVQLCKELKAFLSCPILMLTARDTVMDELVGLESGADDYLKKPVDPSVLLARMKIALNRRSGQPTTQESTLTFGALTITPNQRMVSISDKILDLSRLEYDILLALVQTPDQILSRNTISQRTRGIEYDGIDRTIDIRISKLRKKLEDSEPTPTKIKTIWGKGYLFCSSAWEGP